MGPTESTLLCNETEPRILMKRKVTVTGISFQRGSFVQAASWALVIAMTTRSSLVLTEDPTCSQVGMWGSSGMWGSVAFSHPQIGLRNLGQLLPKGTGVVACPVLRGVEATILPV